MNKIIGRKNEIAILQQLYQKKKSEFVALYGRRRVGKTFLIKELFGGKYSFHMTGLFNANLKRQLSNFYAALHRFDSQIIEEKEVPQNWFDAFQMLIQHLEQDTNKRKIIFIDELPWLDTPRSEFTSALEHFWNSWAFHRDDIFLIVCGSATSWMINQLINNYGGLHNRVTARIHLKPFNLNETEAFLQSIGGNYDRYQLIQLYMTMGGIPYYLEAINPKHSVAQNVDNMFFSSSGTLRNEFYNLYRSLFKKEERHISVIESLAKKAKGLSRKELAKQSKMKNGGTFSKILEELEQCGFIKKYVPFGKKKRGSLYQLTDPYSFFYLKFIKDSKAEGAGAWLAQMDHPKWRAWSGYAFEYVCFYHIEQIKKTLQIGAVYTEISSWRSSTITNGAQIDLVIDRRDRVINLCEIKFSQKVFSINKAFAENLKNKMAAFRTETKTTKSLFLTFITSFGLKENKYSSRLVQNELKMDDLFRD